MSTTRTPPSEIDKTPVDDVRQIRERLCSQADNDIRRMAEQAQTISRQLKEQLGLKSSNNDQ